MTVSVRFRLVLSIAAVLCMVIMVTFSPQLMTDVTLCKIRFIWRPVASWLRPPYLYLVINCIIITIFASSKLPTDNCYDGEDQRKLVDLPKSSAEVECVELSDEVHGNENYCVPATKVITCVNDVQLVDSRIANVRCSNDGTTEGANVETQKSPGPAGFLHPEVVEAGTEGRNKWGVPKPEQEKETLESAWKAITDGRSMPITHHHTGGGNLQDPHRMIKSEKVNQQPSSKRKNISRTLKGLSSSGKLKRDPSLGQDELNKRAEEFISRIKEDMRLQRKESLRQYVEMINSGAY